MFGTLANSPLEKLKSRSSAGVRTYNSRSKRTYPSLQAEA